MDRFVALAGKGARPFVAAGKQVLYGSDTKFDLNLGALVYQQQRTTRTHTDTHTWVTHTHAWICQAGWLQLCMF